MNDTLRAALAYLRHGQAGIDNRPTPASQQANLSWRRIRRLESGTRLQTVVIAPARFQPCVPAPLTVVATGTEAVMAHTEAMGLPKPSYNPATDRWTWV